MDEKSVAPKEIQAVIDFLKQEVASKRTAHIKKRIEENAEKIVYVTDNFYKLSTERRNPKIIGSNHSVGLLSKRQKDAIDLQNVIGTSNGDEDSSSFQEDGYASSTIPLAVPPIKLPEVKRLPHCTTWIFLHKNQRMTEDQSLIGRRRIFYDREGGEALICSDSEDETVEKEEEKKDFAESEDCILRVTAKEFGISDVVLDLLAQCFSRKPCEVKERYEDLIKEVNDSSNLNDVNDGNIDGTSRSYLDKDLDTALDSFDYLFCRRCYVFDCRLHGCSQELVFPAEKQLPWCPPDAEKDPCGPNCFRLVLNLEGNATAGSPGQGNYEEKLLPPGNGGSQVPGRKSAGLSVQMRSKSPSTRKFWMASPASDDDESLQIGAPGCPQQDNVLAIQTMASNVDTLRKEEFADESTYKIEVNGDQSWKPMEVALCEKGQEIFGMNSCLIARNLMNGWKTCLDVFMYMNSSENKPFSQPGENALVEGCKVDGNETVGKGVRRRSTFLRRRVRVRRLMCNWKSAGYHSVRKPISERKGLPYIQYNPCTCQSPCGKDCPCLVNGTCCEKYCGCPKSCKNRFKGCYCVKSLCRSRQCPCFAADRECDPDVCRNCSISCGDGTVGVPFQRGDNYECGNMKLLLQQQERVLLGRSDVSGWGAFLKNSVAKDEYLGEYTGELISHSEADKRGKIYDHENKSFLFNLNDQFVLDAYGMGNKLKFANHSPDPNCYAKVIKVSGDHRVGIFAKEEICAGEELFFDYCYKPDAAPAWARKPEEASAGPSSSRPKKHT